MVDGRSYGRATQEGLRGKKTGADADDYGYCSQGHENGGSRQRYESIDNPAQLSALLITALADVGLSVPLDSIPYVDYPELKLDEHESTEMPFRYVKGEDGGPVMPEVCLEIESSKGWI
jgi:Predicted SAM-dependent RNA methyltransferase